MLRKAKTAERSNQGDTLDQVIGAAWAAKLVQMLGEGVPEGQQSTSSPQENRGQQESPSGGSPDVNDEDCKLLLTFPSARDFPTAKFLKGKPLVHDTIDT